MRALRDAPGHVLCFLPGAGEIARARPRAHGVHGVEVVELHGSLDAAAQDAAMAPASQRRIILATNIAETSLTVPGVAAVVDTGLHKVARYDPDRAIDSLETERISHDAADQRAGRAARLGPGVAIRLWHRADRLRPHREPEIHRVDLSGTVLDILAWGGDPADVRLVRGAVSRSASTRRFELLEPAGRHERRPADRRRTPDAAASAAPAAVARSCSPANGARAAAVACALLSERHYQSVPAGARASDDDRATS